MKRLLSHHHLSVALRTLLLCYTLLKSSRAECNVSSDCSGFKSSTIATHSIVLTPPFRENCTVSIGNTNYAPPNITGLDPGTTYEVTYTCHNCCKEFTTKPAAVRNLHVTEVTEYSVSLNWTRPEGQSSSYVVQWNDGTDHNATRVSHVTISGLRAGAQYAFNVTALANDNHTGGTGTIETAYTRPEVIRNLSVSEITVSSVYVSWSEPEGSRSFFSIQYTNGNVSETHNVSETSFNVTGLTPGERYTFSVVAVAGDNKTSGKTVETTLCTQPDVVRKLNVSDITTSSVFVSWTEPVGISVSYRVEWTNGGVSEHTATHVNITDLTPGGQYTFSVKTLTCNQTEGNSVTASFYTRPEVVRNLSVSEITVSSVYVSWSEPEGNRSFFSIQYTAGNVSETHNVSETSFNVTGLTPGERYTFSVVAVAGDNETFGKTVETTLCTQPDVVRKLNVSDITTSSVFVSWTEPVGISVSYRVEWTNGSVSEHTATHVNITDLTPGGQYTFSVKTLTCNQTEGNSVTASFYTRPEVVRNLSVSEITVSSVYVSWSEPEGNRSFFSIQYTAWNVSETHNVSETSFNVTGLTPGERYTFSVVAVAGDNETSGKTVETTLCTQPDVVRKLNVSDITTSSVFVSWTEPVGISVSYRVEWTNGSVSEHTATHVNITDLTPGGQYTFSVKTLTCNQTEGNSVTASFYTKPEAVRNLKAAVITTSSVLLNWSEPVGTASSYRVDWTDGSENRSQTVNETHIGVVGLIAGAQYKFTVVAVASDQKTESERDEVVLFTYPEMIRNFTLCNITTSSASLTWSAPDGESSFYVVEWWSDGNTLYENANTSQTVFHVDDLTAGKLYYFAVAAVAGDSVTKGVAFNSSHATKPNAIAPPGVHTTTTNSSISVTWSSPAGVVSMYRVEWHDGGTTLNLTTRGTSALLDDLAAGTTYTIKVITVAADNRTEGEPFVLIAVTEPGAVSGLYIAAVTTSSVSVSWTAPQGNVSSYTVRWRSDTDAGIGTDGTSHTVTGLSPGVLYNLTVAAVAGNVTNEGPRALVSTFTRPEKPGSITVEARTTDSLNLRWVLVSGQVQYYDLSVRNADLNFWANRTLLAEPTANLSGLKPGRVYEVTVTAVAGPFTNTSDQIPLATVPSAPGPTAVTQRTTMVLRVEWSPPRDMEGAPHTSYNVSYRAATGGGAAAAAAQYETSATNHTVLSSLSSGTLFNVTVQTVGPQGFRSAWTPVTSAYTLPNPVRDLTASPESTTSVKVQWSHPEGYQPYFKYRIQTSNHTISAELVNTNSSVVTGLQPGTRYTLNVTTVAAPDSHSTTEQTFSYTMPKAVSNLTAVDLNSTAIQLTWDRQDDFKPDTYSYRVTVVDTGDAVSVHTETHTFARLTPGQQYTFTVLTLVDGVGSHPESISTNTQPAAVPGVTAIGTTTNMTVSWGMAGGRVDSYSVLLHRGEGGGLLERNRTGLSNLTRRVLFEGLAPGALYTATVVSASGTLSQNSTAVNATFPNPPGPIAVESQTTSSINVSWARPVDMEPDQYTFRVSHLHPGDHQPVRSNWTSNNWMLLDRLQSGTAYDISVFTVGVRGYLSTVETTLNYTKPHSVSMLKEAGISPTEVVLVWDQPESRLGYSYTVLVTSSDHSFPVHTVSTTGYNASGLLSGTNYTFTVTAQTEDGTQSSPEAVSYFTRPYAVSSLEADTVNSTTILLTWNRPAPQNQSGYTYRVETAARSAGGVVSTTTTTNSSSAVERAQVSALAPGTNYSFCVFVRARDGTEGTASCTSQYTKPEAVQPAVSNDNGSNSSVRVWWTAPDGNVERYVVHLNDSSNTTLEEFDASHNTSWLFSGLSAGRLYSARVTTASGPFNATSGFVTSATFPNPPGGSVDTWTTTGSIGARWGEAPLMGNASSFHYVVSSRRASSSHQNVNVSTSDTTHTFRDLLSGTPYDVCVATVGPLGFTSRQVCSPTVTTNPKDVTSLAASPAEEIVSLSWVRPAGYQQSYRYYVSWADSSGRAVGNFTTAEGEHTVRQLVPGSSYHFNVTTETANGVQATAMSVSTCTDSSPVSVLTCQHPNNGTEARLVLEWSRPKGLNSGFTVSAADSSNAKTTETTTCDDNDMKCHHEVRGLKFYTPYNLEVVTLSCGRDSTPLRHACTTGITAPPVPSERMLRSLVEENSKKHNSFSLRMDSALFNGSGGPITHYGVMVTNRLEGVDTANLRQYLVKTYDDWSRDSDASPMYLAVLATVSGLGRSGQDSPSVTVHIGDTSHVDGYNNGVLMSGDEYRYAIVLFTQLEKSSADLVDVDRSYVSVTGIHPVPVQLSVNMVPIAIGVGASLGVFVVLFVVTIFAVLYWRRLSRKGAPSDIQIHSLRNKVSLAVRVEDYEAYYRKQKADSSCGFAGEFEDLKPVGTAQARTSALALENKPKNRYNNVLPYDASRVKLSVHGSPFDDYINANYIPGYNSRKEFIAAQGPLPCTVSEFWRMIWEKNVMTLVMLTRCNEQGRVKCEEYWPAQVKQFGNITVTTTSEIPLEDWTIREFSIKNVRTAESRSVRHFHFTAWPDHGVPETAELLINFRHLVREHMDQYSRHSPTVVHCSAGVGRTGTFIAIDRLIFQIERDGVVDVYGIIHDLRMHRTLMVQTEDQYVFLNQCAMDIIRSRTGTNVDLIYQNTAALTIYENFEPRRS